MIKIYTQFIRERIAKLRTQENISARELGFRLGQSGGYINSIENGNSLPSLRGFLNICEYFQITPQEFFCEDVEYPIEYPKILHDIMSGCSDLDKETLDSILVLINKINK